MLGYCEVTEEVYRAYWQEVEHARWLERQARKHEVSWQGVPDMPDEDALSLHACSEPPDPDTTALHQALHQALATEPPELVEALWALANGEKTQEDIANEWGTTRQNVQIRIKRLRKRLQKKLKNFC